METKSCIQCGSPLKGRIDKKYCDDQCRTTHNNHLKTDTNLMRNINNILRKNRKIIENFIPPEETKSKATRKRLEEKGFCFTYHTHTYSTKTGSVYFFCYEYGYLPLEHDYFMLVKWVDN
jgi:Ser-tRNA(Ala) deacylase AlaX